MHFSDVNKQVGNRQSAVGKKKIVDCRLQTADFKFFVNLFAFGIFFILPILVCSYSFGQDFPERSIPPKLVNDFANILGDREELVLERKLVAYNDSASTQIAVVTVNSLNGNEIGDYSFRLAEKWGIGQKGKDNGVLILIALKDRKMFIAVERRKFNESVKVYNKYIRSFPQKMVAGMYGFDRKVQFKADEGADKVPEVKF